MSIVRSRPNAKADTTKTGKVCDAQKAKMLAILGYNQISFLLKVGPTKILRANKFKRINGYA